MAAAVSSAVTKLGELVIKEGVLLYGVSSKIEEVKLQLDLMQGFLKDAATKQIQDERVKSWVRNVRKVASDIDVAINTYHVEMAESRFKKFRSDMGFRLWARYKLGYKITQIQSKICLINEARTTFGIANLGDDKGEQRFPSRKVVIANDDHYEIVGFQDVKRQLREDLLGGGRWRVVSVVGQGGLGKTTIAEKVYREVKGYFEITIWLTVSNDFKLVNILRKGLEKLGKEVPNEKDQDQEYLVEEMREIIGKKRYLVVLDDVWTENLFTEFGRALPHANSESRVLVTSRFFNIAKKADPDSTPHTLRFLTQEEGLQLLRRTGYHNPSANSDRSRWDDMINVAKQIVVKCGHLPLAITVVGGLLSTRNPNFNNWNHVLRTMNWQQDGTDYSECMKILSLSYEDLPYSHRPCFLYLACFPEDHQIDADSLLRMWIAEGFIRPTSKTMIMEDLANDCLEELAQRCLIQVTKRSEARDRIKFCRIHDLLRELAVREAEDQNFVHINAQHNGGKHYTARHAAHFQTDVDKFCRSSNLNSLLILDVKIPNRVSFRFLRVLELYRVRTISELPVEVTSMVNLRYLGLRYSSVKSLPKHMDRLQYLQTLDIRGSDVKSVPVELWHIKTLRHFLAFLYQEIDGPPGESDLKELQTLKHMTVRDWENSLPCLESIRRLGLDIDNHRQVEPVLQLVKELNHLRYLCLYWENDISLLLDKMFDMSSFRSYEHIQSLKLCVKWPVHLSLNAAMLPINLTKLVFYWSEFTTDPLPELMKLRSLKILNLSWDALFCDEIVCPAGGFHHLERLTIFRSNQLKEFIVNKGSFPVLKYLCLEKCGMLRMLPDLNHVPTLQELVLELMPQTIKSRCAEPDGEDWHKIKHIPSIIKRAWI